MTKSYAEVGGEEGIFAVGLLAAAPARIAEDVDVRRPDGETVVDGVNVVADGLVVFGAGFGGDDGGDLVDERRVPGGGHADGLREHCGVAGAGDAVEALAPVVVGGNVEAWNGRSGVDELRDLFVECHARDEVVDALLGGKRGIEVGQGFARLRPCVGGDKSEREQESSSSLKWHGNSILQWPSFVELKDVGTKICRSSVFCMRPELYRMPQMTVKKGRLSQVTDHGSESQIAD